MDVWVVAAAAGAGYVAQRLKNLTRGKHNWSNMSSEELNFVKPESSSGEDIFVQREGQVRHDSSSLSQIASTSGFEGEDLVMLSNFGVSSSNSFGDILNSEGRVHCDTDEAITSDLLPQEDSSKEFGVSYGCRRSKSSFRSRRINSICIKPRTALESCLMAQLYKEHAEIEEYTYSVNQERKPIRSLLVTDGSRIISQALPHQSSCIKPSGNKSDHQSSCIKPSGNKSAFGVPRLPKAKARLSKMASGNQNNAQGSPNSALLFYLGLTMGIVYALTGHKREIEKLRKLLKQTENLVQDLQEELEMKDSLTVKELAVEDYESLDMQNDSYPDNAMQASSVEHKLQSCNDECCGQNAEEQESLRKIEAELQAELDMLESNFNSSRLEGKQSDVAEIDQYFISDVIKGELRADLFGAKTDTDTQTHADRDGSGASTPRSVHYPVSPRELSLKLHEVIQSRLEERVKELEAALEQSRRKIKYMESDYTKTRRSSRHESPVSIDGLEPVVINLSGEALAAYNEAYDVFTKLSESDEECDPSRQSLCDGLNGLADGYSSRDESEEGENEMERMLIRQIVEKARQGSPAVLKAQRAFLSNDENLLLNKLG